MINCLEIRFGRLAILLVVGMIGLSKFVTFKQVSEVLQPLFSMILLTLLIHTPMYAIQHYNYSTGNLFDFVSQAISIDTCSAVLVLLRMLLPADCTLRCSRWQICCCEEQRHFEIDCLASLLLESCSISEANWHGKPDFQSSYLTMW